MSYVLFDPATGNGFNEGTIVFISFVNAEILKFPPFDDVISGSRWSPADPKGDKYIILDQ